MSRENVAHLRQQTQDIYIRDSSGWDTRYLTWSRLYGEVGFSGWVVGVLGVQ
ncbi:MAG: hypothetical protein JO352_28725 [Chloroflexi bacterium]|nr:hypothetical protein [Chloroflexota bacterium]